MFYSNLKQIFIIIKIIPSNGSHGLILDLLIVFFQIFHHSSFNKKIVG